MDIWYIEIYVLWQRFPNRVPCNYVANSALYLLNALLLFIIAPMSNATHRAGEVESERRGKREERGERKSFHGASVWCIMKQRRLWHAHCLPQAIYQWHWQCHTYLISPLPSMLHIRHHMHFCMNIEWEMAANGHIRRLLIVFRWYLHLHYNCVINSKGWKTHCSC